MKNELLAPNGKPSNLNAMQYELVRTPAFKKWFGDWENDPVGSSKVIDENGEPLVVYHGTNSDFTKFSLEKVGSSVDYGMWGSGFYFSPLRSFSKHYGSKILKLFLNIRNPFVRNPNIQGSTSQFKSVYGKEASLNLRNEILSYNYDGVFQYESGQKNPLTQIVAFEPNQIKLANGTNATFDGSNTDIRFKDGGNVAYHGSPILKEKRKLTPAKSGELGAGLYFTRDFKYAENYSLPRGEIRNILEAQKGAVAKLNLSKLNLKEISKEEYLNKRNDFYDAEQKINNGNWSLEIANNAEQKLIKYYEYLGYDGLEIIDEPQGVIFTESLNKLEYAKDIIFKKGGEVIKLFKREIPDYLEMFLGK